jgi:hypothetical protein
MHSPVLPARPLRLQAGFVRRSYVSIAICATLGLAALVGYPAWQAIEARAIVADEALWSSGVAARRAHAEGTVTSRYIVLKDYDVAVTYVDQAGQEHKGRARFDTLFAAIDLGAEPTVHYDAAAPQRFALSWSHDVQGGRWASVALLALAGAALGVVFAKAAWRALRQLAAARLAAAASDEVELEIAGVVESGRVAGVVFYTYRVPTPSGEKEREVSFSAKKGHKPLFAGPEETHLLALRSARAPAEPVVLRSDLYPFEASEADRLAVTTALEHGDA